MNSKEWIPLPALILLTAFFLPSVVLAARAIPDDNLAYPALIERREGRTGFGSGFFLNTDFHSFLVTAKHVLFDLTTKTPLSPKVTITSYSRDPNDLQPNIMSLDITQLFSGGDIKYHPNQDIVLIRLADAIPNESKRKQRPGATITHLSKLGIIGANLQTLKKFDNILIANDIVLFGYPRSIGLHNIPQVDYQRPLLRKGIVAGVNQEQKTIILDCPVYPGNSGGPVLELEAIDLQTHLRIIGVATQWIPAEDRVRGIPIHNSGYSVAVPIDFVLETLKQFELCTTLCQGLTIIKELPSPLCCFRRYVP